MDLVLMLVVGAVLAAPLVVLVRRPGWGPIADTHPDADRLVAELDAVRARTVVAPRTPRARSVVVLGTLAADGSGSRS